jgi:adenylate cyclase
MSAKPAGAMQRQRLHLVRWLRKGRVAVVALVAIGAILVANARWFRTLALTERWETQAYDIRFRSRGAEPAHPQVVIAGITDSSLNQSVLEPDLAENEAVALMHASTWPWPRSIHARIIERLFESGARIVAVDIVFAAERAEDDELAPVLEKYKDRIVLASVVQESEGRLSFFRPNARLRDALGAADAIGYASVIKDPLDGIVRRFDFRTSELREFGMDDDTQDLRNFAALAVAKFSGGSVGSGYGAFLNYQGTARTYAHLPVEEIFIKRRFEQGSRFESGNIFRDKLVFYGPIAEVIHDVHNTPFGVMPGVEIHAQLAGSLLNGRLITWASDSVSLLLTILAAACAVAAVLLIRNPVWQVIGILLVAALYWAGTQAAFTANRIVIPAVPPLFAAGVTGAFGIVFLFFLEQWEKVHTRKVLNRFVSKRIAAVILKNAEEFEHGRQGERRPVTILFSDIRSFTTWSESAQPEHLVGQLNEYFEAMVGHIEDTEGNAQKFIGDAILAAWGDTHTNGGAEDARRAVATAVKMRATLKTLNAGWAGRDDRIVISIGMGINHGDVVVGEVGHPERREYTVLGDGVNFAARLESATKQFHTDCLVGEQVEALTREHFIYRHVDYLRVKGKTRPVNVYTLIGDRTVAAPPWLAEYHCARGLYVERKFAEAAALFRAVKEQIGGEDFLCDMYAQRCDTYATIAPPADWDGSYTMTEK